MFNIKKLIRSKNMYENGIWYAQIENLDGGAVEVGIQGNERGAEPQSVELAERVLSGFSKYKKEGIGLITSFIPNIPEDGLRLFSIDVVPFTVGTHGVQEICTGDCFMVSWDCSKYTETCWIFTVKFVLDSQGEIYNRSVEIWML